MFVVDRWRHNPRSVERHPPVVLRFGFERPVLLVRGVRELQDGTLDRATPCSTIVITELDSCKEKEKKIAHPFRFGEGVYGWEVENHPRKRTLLDFAAEIERLELLVLTGRYCYIMKSRRCVAFTCTVWSVPIETLVQPEATERCGKVCLV